MAAQTNNDGAGIAGLAGGWYDESWTVGDRGSGCLILTAASPAMSSACLRKGLLYAAGEGADVASMSFYTAETDDWKKAIETAVDSGMVLVAAAANDPGSPVEFPARCLDVIAVGASDYLDHDCFYQSSGGSLEVVAPSAACVLVGNQCVDPCIQYYAGDYLCWVSGEWCVCDSLFLWTTGRDGVSNAYGFFGGTSAATPQVSALAGLLLSYDSTLTREEVRQLIRSSAQDGIGDDEDLQGRDAHYGFGRIDAYAALFLARGGGATTRDLRLCYDVSFDRDVKVSAGHTLTILPGVTVEFAANSDAANLGVDSGRCELIVEGTLIARGIDADTLVTFTSSGSSAEDWYGIRAPADTGSLDLRYCAIKNVYKGVAVDNPDDLELAHLEIDNCTAHGIYCEDCGSSAKVDSCTITTPGLVGIEARGCEGLTLRGHSITDATAYGIKCTEACDLTVEHNAIIGDTTSQDFIGIFYKPASGDSTYAITDNTVERCGSRGISVEGGGATSAAVEDNTVSDQGYGRGTVGIHLNKSRAKVRRNTSEKKTNGVVALVGVGSPKWIPDLGRDSSGEHGDNQWLDNSVWYVWAGSTGGNPLKAERNWHGTRSPNPNKFTNSVDWQPALQYPPGRGAAPSDPEDDAVFQYTLTQNRPNPFSPATNIRYAIPVAGDVNLRIYNTAGQVVRVLVNEPREAGSHEELWDGCDDSGRRLASGVYFARLAVDGKTRVRKLALLK
ncbi:MAG: right-handed parallel beta-helix repeat-containing protein [Candidatus Eisenbacteria sp.]|nr:right-handed parallel beta-helix repeat-containing protein [Candidatus Eisenbacteria bacterium]